MPIAAPAAAPGGAALNPGGTTVEGLSIVKPPYGVLAAISLDKGDLLWQTPHGDTPDVVRNHPKLKDMNIKWPAAGDPDKAVSKQYHTLGHGMMGNTMNGHSFLLVGPTGNILFRGDYGGPPKYTMYVPIDKLLSDIRSVRPQ